MIVAAFCLDLLSDGSYNPHNVKGRPRCTAGGFIRNGGDK